MRLPTIHLNGTGLATLTREYDAAAEKLCDFIDAWRSIEFNARDYYPQGPDAWTKALAEREAQSVNLRAVRQYLQEIREHLYDEEMKRKGN
jgi:hypothetical protein